MRRFLSLTAAVVTLALATNVVFAASDRGVRTIGDEIVIPNTMIQATIRFQPGMIRVTSGDEVTWTHDDRTTAPHTVTVVAEFPIRSAGVRSPLNP